MNPPFQREAVQLGNALAARHWRVWEWMNAKIGRALHARTPKRPTSLNELWRLIISNKIHDGDFIEFREQQSTETVWFLQEWIPKVPGDIWTKDGWMDLEPRDIRQHLDLRSCFHIRDKRRIDVAMYHYQAAHWEQRFYSSEVGAGSLQAQGFGWRPGCYRPAIGRLEDRYAVLGLTTACEALVDFAFPIIVSEQVYRAFQKARLREEAVEFEGIVRFRDIGLSPEFAAYLSAVGAPKEPAVVELLTTSTGVRSVSGELISPLDSSFLSNDTHPLVTLRVDGKNVQHETRKDGILLVSRFDIVNPSEQILDLDGVTSALGFLLGYDRQFHTDLAPLTDFDARVRRFSTPISIGENPKDNPEKVSALRDSI